MINQAKDKSAKTHIKTELNVADLGERRSLSSYKNGQIFTLNIDQVSTYDKNPRQHKNSEYESIYESIKANGLEDSLSVTQRPDDDLLSFFLIRGGNTRLAILKELYKETKDKKYYEFSARFKNWKSESDAVIGHLRENDARGDYVFIDRALGVRQAKIELQAESNETISDKALIKVLTSQGYKLSGKDLRRMNYAVDNLNPHCPKILTAHIGPRIIDDIKKLDKKSCELFEEMFPDSDSVEWQDKFASVLQKQEENYLTQEEVFSYQYLYDGVLDALSNDNPLSANRLAFLLDERINGRKTSQEFSPDLLLNDDPIVKEITPPPSTPIARPSIETTTEENHPAKVFTPELESSGEEKEKTTSQIISGIAPPSSFITEPNNEDEDIDKNEDDCHFIYDTSSQHLVHSQWMYPESANHDFSIFKDMPLTCKDRIEAAPLPNSAKELREILFYKAFFFKHYLHVPARVVKINSGAGFTLNKIPHDQGMKLVFENQKDSKTRIGKTTKHYIGWWILLGFSDLLHQSLIGNFDLIKSFQPDGNLKDYLLTPKDNRLDTIDLIYSHQIGFGYLSELAPLFTSLASPKELQLFIEIMLIHNRLMNVTNQDIWEVGS